MCAMRGTVDGPQGASLACVAMGMESPETARNG